MINYNLRIGHKSANLDDDDDRRRRRRTTKKKKGCKTCGFTA
jgi:hypothetical protein